MATPDTTDKPKRKSAARVISATTANYLTIMAKKRKPQTDTQMRAAMPSMHPSAIHTLLGTGFISEAPGENGQGVIYQITTKGRYALKLRRAQQTRQAKEEAAAMAASSNPNQLALSLNVAQPRTFHRGGTYDGAELLRPVGIPQARFDPYSLPSRVGSRLNSPRAIA